jgi:hypothetical protein
MRARAASSLPTLALASLLAGLGLLGCTEDEPCDGTSVYRNRHCVLRATIAALDAAAPPDGPPPGPAGDGGPGFGAPCVDDPSCAGGGAADRCFKRPGEAAGFCSAVGCDKEPGVCPAGWLCYDLSTIVPGSPWGCVKL